MSIRSARRKTLIAAIAEGRRVEESIAFGASPAERLAYAVALDGQTLAARLSSRGIEVLLPSEAGRAWATGDTVGLEGSQPVGDGRTLRILVEKDFACLTTRPHEDDTDAFPNPNESC